MAEYAPSRSTASAGQTDFPIPWTYNLAKPATVVMIQDGVELTQGVDYNIVEYYTARLTTPCEGGEYVVLLRRSDFTTNPVDWTDESRLTETAHDNQDLEFLRRDAELKAASGLPRSNEHDGWTAKDENSNPLVISDVQDPSLPTDAANKRYVDGLVNGSIEADAGVYRVVYTSPGTGGGLINEVDGNNNRFQIITDGKAVIPSKSIVLAWWDERLISVDDLELHGNGLDALFDNPPPCGTRVEIMVIVGVSVQLADGTLLPPMIALATGKIIQGDASGYGAAVALNTISISSFGVPTGNLAMASKKITSLGTATAATDAAHKGYVDAAVAAALPFPSVEFAVALPYSTSTKVTNAVQNAKTGTQQITLNFYDNSGDASEWDVWVADDAAMTTNRKLATHWRVTGTAGNHDVPATFLVPAGKYWRAEQVTTNAAAFTFTYQRGGPA